MQIGALIVAAGMSQRMGEFKPLLSIGSISVARWVMDTPNRDDETSALEELF